MTGPGYTDADVAFLRENAPRMSDAELAAALGWKPGKAWHVRNKLGIPAKSRVRFWTPERTAIAKRLYIDEGWTSAAVAQELGCEPAMVRRKAKAAGWERPRSHTTANLCAAQRRRMRERPDLAPPPRAAPAPMHKPIGGALTAYMRQTPPMRDAPVSAPLRDRLIAALRARPMAAPTLASMLGEKEAIVTLSLAGLRHEGVVRPGDPPPAGPRFRPFHLAEAAE
jgi:hypothetical protein